MKKLAIALIIAACSASVFGAERFVATNGSGTTCTKVAPCTLDNAVANAGGVTINAGDVVLMRGGTYTNGNVDTVPKYDVTISGTATAPIEFRPYPGERAIVDGADSGVAIRVHGSNLIFRELEVFDSVANPTHCNCSTGTGNFSQGFQTNYGYGSSNVKIINCIIHDVKHTGISDFADGPWIAYGNVIYYFNCYSNQGHGVYFNNASPNDAISRRVIDSNIMFDGGGYNYQGWGDHHDGRVQNNIEFQAGRLYTNTPSGGATVIGHGIGGGATEEVRRYLWDSNYGYAVDALGFGAVFGYHSGAPSLGLTDSTFSNNYSVGGDYRWDEMLDRNNRIYGVFYEGQQFVNGVQGPLTINPPLGLAANTTLNDSSRPSSGKKIVVIPNIFEAGRCNVAIYNWDHSNTVAVDLSTCVRNGDDYAVYWAPLFAAKTAAVASTYAGGTVTFPMTAAVLGAMPLPTWSGALQPPATALPEFAAFVVRTTRRRS